MSYASVYALCRLELDQILPEWPEIALDIEARLPPECGLNPSKRNSTEGWSHSIRHAVTSFAKQLSRNGDSQPLPNEGRPSSLKRFRNSTMIQRTSVKSTHFVHPLSRDSPFASSARRSLPEVSTSLQQLQHSALLDYRIASGPVVVARKSEPGDRRQFLIDPQAVGGIGRDRLAHCPVSSNSKNNTFIGEHNRMRSLSKIHDPQHTLPRNSMKSRSSPGEQKGTCFIYMAVYLYTPANTNNYWISLILNHHNLDFFFRNWQIISEQQSLEMLGIIYKNSTAFSTFCLDYKWIVWSPECPVDTCFFAQDDSIIRYPTVHGMKVYQKYFIQFWNHNHCFLSVGTFFKTQLNVHSTPCDL